MKRYLLLLILVVVPAIGMHLTPDQKSNQLIQAIRNGDVTRVKALVGTDQAFITNYVRKFANYGGYALLGLEKNISNPALAPAYLEIAEYLQMQGAQIDRNKLEALKKQIQLPAAQPVLIPVSKPAPAASKPTAKPVPAPTPVIAKPSGTAKAPANYDELLKLVESHNYKAVENYLQTHTTSNLTSFQTSTIISKPISNLAALAPSEVSPIQEVAQGFRRIIRLLLKNGFKPFSQMAYEATRKGNFGMRAGTVNSALILAIKGNNLAEVKHLVEYEDYDPNETDTSALSPLATAAQSNAKEIAKYLASQGASLYEKEQAHRAKLKEWGIPGY